MRFHSAALVFSALLAAQLSRGRRRREPVIKAIRAGGLAVGRPELRVGMVLTAVQRVKVHGLGYKAALDLMKGAERPLTCAAPLPLVPCARRAESVRRGVARTQAEVPRPGGGGCEGGASGGSQAAQEGAGEGEGAQAQRQAQQAAGRQQAQPQKTRQRRRQREREREWEWEPEPERESKLGRGGGPSSR